MRLSERDEPQPDLSLLGRRPRPDSSAPPGPEDVLLVVEVSDTTLAYDKNVKLPLYSRAGIPEAWIVDLSGRKVEIHSDPGPGGYRVSRSCGPDEEVVSAAVEGVSVPVDEVLG